MKTQYDWLKELGSLLKQERLKHKLTRKQLLIEAGFRASAEDLVNLKTLEAGEQDVRWETLNALFRALGQNVLISVESTVKNPVYFVVNSEYDNRE